MEKCTTCGSLEELQSKLDCTIALYSKIKYNASAYNLDICCDDRLLRDLLRYKRILKNRLYEYTYPCTAIQANDIITQVALRVIQEECTVCPDCPVDTIAYEAPPPPLPTCSTYTLFGSIQGNGIFHYFTCEGIPTQVEADESGISICANNAHPVVLISGYGVASLGGVCHPQIDPPPIDPPPTSTCVRYRITGNPATSPVLYNFSYVECLTTKRITLPILTNDVIDLCCKRDSIIIDPLFTVSILSQTCIP